MKFRKIELTEDVKFPTDDSNDFETEENQYMDDYSEDYDENPYIPDSEIYNNMEEDQYLEEYLEELEEKENDNDLKKEENKEAYMEQQEEKKEMDDNQANISSESDNQSLIERLRKINFDNDSILKKIESKMIEDATKKNKKGVRITVSNRQKEFLTGYYTEQGFAVSSEDSGQQNVLVISW